MNRLVRLGFVFGLMTGAVLPLQAETDKVTNVPDSVSLFSYARADGQSGLRFAWSPDRKQWLSVADGYDYVKCDFGPWGREKKMFAPHLWQNTSDGSWHCVWTATRSGKVLAHAASPDLLKWGAQSYFTEADRQKYESASAFPTKAVQVTVDGKQADGWMQRVPYAVVEQLTRYAEHKKYRQQLYDERAEQDPVRFAGLKPVTASVEVHASDGKAISDHLIGIFFEDINYAADGGLYAELVQNRDFEYSPKDGSHQRWNSDYAWSVAGGEGSLSVATDAPIHENNPHYAVLDIKQAGAALQNDGFDGIALKKGEKYDFSCFARIAAGSKGGKVEVSLLDENGKTVGTASVKVTSTKWKTQKAVLVAKADVAAAKLALRPEEAGTYHFDMVSLFPQHTFKGRKNGLRADLAQTLADLHPRFVRFPGGCVAHGDGIDNIYDWKGSIGPLEARKPLRNLWGYHQTRGLGYFEYFQFCEDIGAEPVPVVAAGVPCQNSGTCSHHSKDELGCNGQQGGIPMDEMPAYVQDVLDLIEYANGDARKTEWGRKRAEAGHPEPFHLKYIGIGNEDLITEVFEERFTMIYNAVREKYPEVTVIGTVGPFYEGTDYDEGWKLATRLEVPMVDEHYYVAPGWFIHNQDYYDRYDRHKSKVYLGEYAAHLPGRPSNLETALSEALYLTAVERNADVVTMTSYAPLLAKEGHTQWRPDLIYFNNGEVKLTPDYYTQQLFRQNAGNEYFASTIRLDNQQDAVRKRIGVSAVKDAVTGDYIVKLVNMLPVEVTSQVKLDGISLDGSKAQKTVLTGRPADEHVCPVTESFDIQGEDFVYTLPAYSLTVIRIGQTLKK